MYVLVLVTGGLFGFVWLALMMRDVDVVTGRRGGWSVLPLTLLGGLAAHLILLALIISFPPASATREALIVPDILLAAILLLLLFGGAVIIDNKIRLALGLRSSIREALLVVLLTFAMFVSLVFLQRRLNDLSERAGTRPPLDNSAA